MRDWNGSPEDVTHGDGPHHGFLTFRHPQVPQSQPPLAARPPTRVRATVARAPPRAPRHADVAGEARTPTRHPGPPSRDTAATTTTVAARQSGLRPPLPVTPTQRAQPDRG